MVGLGAFLLQPVWLDPATNIPAAGAVNREYDTKVSLCGTLWVPFGCLLDLLPGCGSLGRLGITLGSS